MGWKLTDAVTPLSIADLICASAQRHGIMEVSLCDHDMVQKINDASVLYYVKFLLGPDSILFFSEFHLAKLSKEAGEPLSFRYTVSLKTKTHCFVPKPIENGVDVMSMRPSMLGAVLKDHYETLRASDFARVLWEAYSVLKGVSIPAIVADKTESPEGIIGCCCAGCDHSLEAEILALLSNLSEGRPRPSFIVMGFRSVVGPVFLKN